MQKRNTIQICSVFMIYANNIIQLFMVQNLNCLLNLSELQLFKTENMHNSDDVPRKCLHIVGPVPSNALVWGFFV